jgi:hypothetical protein
VTALPIQIEPATAGRVAEQFLGDVYIRSVLSQHRGNSTCGGKCASRSASEVVPYPPLRCFAFFKRLVMLSVRVTGLLLRPEGSRLRQVLNWDRTGHISLVLKVQIEGTTAVSLFDADLIGRLPDDVV